MKSITLARFDPEPPDEPTRWQVGYDIVLDDDSERHAVTTVYRHQAPGGSRDEVLAIADAAVLPGLILEDRRLLPSLPEVQPAATPRFDDVEAYYFGDRVTVAEGSESEGTISEVQVGAEEGRDAP